MLYYNSTSFVYENKELGYIRVGTIKEFKQDSCLNKNSRHLKTIVLWIFDNKGY